ncbi:hypothetical protein PLA107_014810 [Pseudomonas amygdali pv. lachrymans str. M301315]|uniref:Uncharacterized protein n=1 Tax=Pseudomonas amygdali pv. lachrymans str. M301315 TaxID=629260 RepID=A0AAD0PSN4_PSEAV|nr:hypothetical protein PLA107_014755 [Pseudomonas amygdali pv. lachrymans str. M301315]AXH56436.1 hypothetical protein PLA107_014810 [Pseudomonas amygdali pv. lachrymans str. M301315]PWD03967.1 hypothetical protein CX658_03090 [Pseudomonas amygdali pv. lachrymans]
MFLLLVIKTVFRHISVVALLLTLMVVLVIPELLSPQLVILALMEPNILSLLVSVNPLLRSASMLRALFQSHTLGINLAIPRMLLISGVVALLFLA